MPSGRWDPIPVLESHRLWSRAQPGLVDAHRVRVWAAELQECGLCLVCHGQANFPDGLLQAHSPVQADHEQALRGAILL